jgi:hypothetical protein
MTSIDHLKGIFGADSHWPSPELTLEQDLIDLGWHHKEFQRRTSFTYTVMSREESTCLGCVYIYPGTAPDYDADVYCWIRASHAQALDAMLHRLVKQWLDSAWPFRRVRYPGR